MANVQGDHEHETERGAIPVDDRATRGLRHQERVCVAPTPDLADATQVREIFKRLHGDLPRPSGTRRLLSFCRRAAVGNTVPVTRANELRVGEFRRQVRLGTEAIYRVVRWDCRVAEVEVIHAPGLAAGQRIRLTREAVALMAVMSDEEDPTRRNPKLKLSTSS